LIRIVGIQQGVVKRRVGEGDIQVVYIHHVEDGITISCPSPQAYGTKQEA